MSSTLEENDEETGRSSISIGADEKVTVLDFLDEYWFLQNILCQVRMDLTRRPPLDMISSPRKAKETIDHPSPLNCALVRTPSLPSPRVQEKMASPDGEVAASKLSKSKLRHCYSSLNEYQSYSYSKSTTPSPGSTRSSRPPREMKANGSMRQRANSDLTISRMSYKKAFNFQEKKSKSLTDLECFEVQGFRDLGFVFDKGGLNATLVKVIPGLRDQRPAGDEVDDDKLVSRPYLSEAWLSQRSAGPLAVRWGGRRSAEDMKEQIRFWARTVACNVRQDC